MWISGTPNVKLSYFISSTSQSNCTLPFPLNQPKCYFFFSARYALYHAIRILGLKEGDHVLLPSYCCGTEIDPFIENKMFLHFYKINENLTIDLNDIYLKLKKNQNIKALLVTHYLGFPQPMREITSICREKGILLIEDCAHAFLSNNSYNHIPLGSYGNGAVFSLRKTLPIPDGAVLYINSQRWQPKYSLQLQGPNTFAILFRLMELLKNTTTYPKNEKMQRLAAKCFFQSRWFFIALNKYIKKGTNALINPNSYEFHHQAIRWSISKISKKALINQNWQMIFNKRRDNFIYLLNKLTDFPEIKLVFEKLPKGVCPLLFPILVKNRKNFHHALLSKGVDNHPWWNYFHFQVPWEKFPTSIYLKKKLLGLPIHQDLNEIHMEIIYTTIKEILQNAKS